MQKGINDSLAFHSQAHSLILCSESFKPCNKDGECMDIILKESDQDDLLSLCEDNEVMRQTIIEFLLGVAEESMVEEDKTLKRCSY